MLIFIIITFCLLAAGFLAILLYNIIKIKVSYKKSITAPHYNGFTSLLNYAALVDEGIILGKNGSLTAGWEYSSLDHNIAENEELNVLSNHINNFITQLDENLTFHIDAFRDTHSSYFYDNIDETPLHPLLKKVERERANFFNKAEKSFSVRYVLTITYLPPKILTNKVSNLVLEGYDKNKIYDPNHIINKFKELVEKVENLLSGFLKVKRLKSFVEEKNGILIHQDALLNHIQQCIIGEHQPIVLPKNEVFLDSVLGGYDFIAGTELKINDKYIRVISIDRFPNEVFPTILNKIMHHNGTYRFNMRYIHLDQITAEHTLDVLTRKWKSKTRGFLDIVLDRHTETDMNATGIVEELILAKTHLKNGSISFGYYSANFIITEESLEKLDELTKVIEQELFTLGFGGRIEHINALEAYLGSLPSHTSRNLRKNLIHSSNLSHLLPTNSIWVGTEHNPCPLYPNNSPALAKCIATDGIPFYLNLHVNDVGHTLIIGQTGSGKSVLLSFLALQAFRYPNVNVFIFDKGSSAYTLTKALGGKHFNFFHEEETTTFAPLKYIDSDSDIAFLEDWFSTILSLNDYKVTNECRKSLNLVFKRLQELKKQGDLLDISLLIKLLDNQNLKKALTNYFNNKGIKKLLDGVEDNVTFSQCTTFEMDALLELGANYSIPILLYIFRRIEQTLNIAANPSYIILDEAWILLKHPLFKDKINDWLKTFRKKNCAVIMATQDLNDIINNDISSGIINNTPTKIYLPNPAANNPETKEYYKKLGLTNKQINFIANGTPKKDYFITAVNQQRMINLELTPTILDFIAVSDVKNIQKVKFLEKQCGDDWINQWPLLKKLSLEEIQKQFLTTTSTPDDNPPPLERRGSKRIIHATEQDNDSPPVIRSVRKKIIHAIEPADDSPLIARRGRKKNIQENKQDENSTPVIRRGRRKKLDETV